MPMSPIDRKIAMMRKRITQAEIGRRTGFSQTYVHEVVKGTRRSAVIEAAIVRAIGLKPADVFPPRDAVELDPEPAALA